MPVWPTPAVETEPDIAPVRWQVLEAERGRRYLVGARADELAGRVSARIVEFDVIRLIATTQPGRKYRLLGPPGYDDNGAYVWEQWCTVNGVKSWRNVTSFFYPNRS